MTLPDPAVIHLPATIAQNERIVERGFWKKLLAVAGRIPFADDAAAAYFCAADPTTPTRVRGVLFAALAYFVMPFDVIRTSSRAWASPTTRRCWRWRWVWCRAHQAAPCGSRARGARLAAAGGMMRYAEIEKFCLSLKGAKLSIQWGSDHVYKVGDKMFAVLGPAGDEAADDVLQGGAGQLRDPDQAEEHHPAPYLARAQWVNLQRLDALSTKELKAYLERAHSIVASGLTKKKRAELGIAC